MHLYKASVFSRKGAELVRKLITKSPANVQYEANFIIKELYPKTFLGATEFDLVIDNSFHYKKEIHYRSAT